jgi:hypothetical protein
MHPTALMQPLVTVVASVKIAAQHPGKVWPNQLFDHLS